MATQMSHQRYSYRNMNRNHFRGFLLPLSGYTTKEIANGIVSSPILYMMGPDMACREILQAALGKGISDAYCGATRVGINVRDMPLQLQFENGHIVNIYGTAISDGSARLGSPTLRMPRLLDSTPPPPWVYMRHMQGAIDVNGDNLPEPLLPLRLRALRMLTEMEQLYTARIALSAIVQRCSTYGQLVKVWSSGPSLFGFPPLGATSFPHTLDVDLKNRFRLSELPSYVDIGLLAEWAGRIFVLYRQQLDWWNAESKRRTDDDSRNFRPALAMTMKSMYVAPRVTRLLKGETYNRVETLLRGTNLEWRPL